MVRFGGGVPDRVPLSSTSAFLRECLEGWTFPVNEEDHFGTSLLVEKWSDSAVGCPTGYPSPDYLIVIFVSFKIQ